MVRSYVPEAGDLVWLEFDPQVGREQAGRRPAIVLTPQVYNKKTSLMICCPLTTQIKGYPFEVIVELSLCSQFLSDLWLAQNLLAHKLKLSYLFSLSEQGLLV